jgi:hypothetical protein
MAILQGDLEGIIFSSGGGDPVKLVCQLEDRLAEMGGQELLVFAVEALHE